MKKLLAQNIREIVAEMDDDIQQLKIDTESLTECRNDLVRYYGGETDLEVILEVPVEAAPPKPKAKRKAAKADDTGGSATFESALQHARNLIEPVTTAKLSSETGLDTKLCGNLITRWALKGYLTRVGRGEYKRTGNFPAAPDAAQ